MIQYSFTQYLELLAEHSQKQPFPGLKTKHLPFRYSFRTQAPLEKLEEIISASGMILSDDVTPLMKVYQHPSGLVQGHIALPELDTRYGKTLFRWNEEFVYDHIETLPAYIPAVVYNSCFSYKTIGRKRIGKPEAVTEITEKIMRALHAEHIPAFWEMSGRERVVVGNCTDRKMLN
ncbi:MAG TPA: hypothetical protein VJB13_03175 [Candidatus Nanoarchaeia archaeon]|nr:hypothetical protein [Candidatus Nanoarchaeia archaeon]